MDTNEERKLPPARQDLICNHDHSEWTFLPPLTQRETMSVVKHKKTLKQHFPCLTSLFQQLTHQHREPTGTRQGAQPPPPRALEHQVALHWDALQSSSEHNFEVNHFYFVYTSIQTT